MATGQILEFVEAIYNTPSHINNIAQHEKNIESAGRYARKLSECIMDYANYSKKIEKITEKMKNLLDNYPIELISTKNTVNENEIIRSFSECSSFIQSEQNCNQRSFTILNNQISKTLEEICADVGSLKENKKKNEKQRAKVESIQEKIINVKSKPLNMSTVEKSYYRELALLDVGQCEYVLGVQDIEERMKFEISECALLIINNFVNTSHELYELGKTFMNNNAYMIQSVQSLY
ncbi:hypothetical protein A3Q56_08098 [Intoshia linei]|uniref:BAR domain-containing protein n=1 Tax=Intoshia linei TaxID=1819745 RepID=A0A177AS55_9BILA|nr:hypothetical protein A3Q56_08098 [Intoshia linei]